MEVYQKEMMIIESSRKGHIPSNTSHTETNKRNQLMTHLNEILYAFLLVWIGLHIGPTHLRISREMYFCGLEWRYIQGPTYLDLSLDVLFKMGLHMRPIPFENFVIG